MTKQSCYGGIEAGGTKFICAIGKVIKDGTECDIIEKVKFNTEDPDTTIKNVAGFFNNFIDNKDLDLSNIGIGSFGPVSIKEQSITKTPKPGWSNFQFVEELNKLIKKEGITYNFNTDVNAAALGEYKWGNAKKIKNFIYLTVGTGIGGGGMINGKLMGGLVHPEMGHIKFPYDNSKIPQKYLEDKPKGFCIYHRDCLEGLASGTAMKKRWNKPAEELFIDHIAWEIEADYLAQAITNFIFTLSPEKVILGGSVMNHPHLIKMIRKRVQKLVNGYIVIKEITDDIENYIVPPALGDEAGVKGAIGLAIYPDMVD